MLSNLYAISKPALFLSEPERAHGMAIKALKSGLVPKAKSVNDPALEVTLWERKFPNPVGLAAGFDKNAEALIGLFNLGFGHIEAGTVTPKPQEGNPRPRIFRHPGTESVINRMGFPNQGAKAFKANLEKALNHKPHPSGVLGINIGMNKNRRDPAKDYCQLVKSLGPLADYIAVNISSPNTPGLRRLQSRDHLLPLLESVMNERAKSCGSMPPPLLVKLAPDLDNDQLASIAEIFLEAQIDGMILTNTSLERPAELPDRFASQSGGLSGAPIRRMSTQIIRKMYGLTSGKIPIIGVGGVFSGKDAYDKIRAGASLVQIYTSFIYRGPYVAESICRELSECLKKDGFESITQAVGKDHA